MNTNEENIKEKTLEEVSGGLPYKLDPRKRDEGEDSDNLPVHTGVTPNSFIPVPGKK